MPKPSTAELLNAIHVLDQLGERLTTQANDTSIELSETPSGSHQADQMAARAIDQTTRIQFVTAQLKAWRQELLEQRQTVCHHV